MLQDQIFNAKDEDNDLPIHKAAMHGNPTVISWIIGKWEAAGKNLDIDTPDHQGYSPLYLVCYRGFLGAEGIMASSPEVKKKRIECAKILLKAGANVNYLTPKLRMTPLHWAAYQGDSEMVELLLDSGAIQKQTILGNTPIDIAGFCNCSEVVMTFCKHLERKIQNEIAEERGKGTDDVGNNFHHLLLEDIEQDEVA